jgi:hypothetical protein
MANQHEGNKTGGKKTASRTPKEKKAFKKQKREAQHETAEALRHVTGK